MDILETQGPQIDPETSIGELYLSTPLDPRKAQIRVVHLEPRTGKEDIYCTLEVIDMDDTARQGYFALSYEWGNPDISGCEIFLNGVRFAVRTNLWWALWHIRARDNDITIWIDALCNEQENGARETIK